MEQRVEQLETIAQLQIRWARLMEQQAGRVDVQARRTEEQSGLMEQNAKERGEIMNQLLARVGLLEADVARIDATHS